MIRRIAPVVCLLLLGTAVATGVAPAGGAETGVAVQSVDLSVEQPSPGETVTLDVEIGNVETSSGSVEIDEVYVRDRGDTSVSSSGAREAVGGNGFPIGWIAPGDSITIPLQMTLEEPGAYQFTIWAVARGPNGTQTRINHPLTIEVAEPDSAAVSVADLDPVAGGEEPFNVTVSNGDTDPISNVRLELGGDVALENADRVAASIDGGTQVTYTYDGRFAQAGERTLDATLTYTTSDDSTRTIHRNVTTDVEPATVETDLTAETTVVNGSSAIDVSLSEFGNVELSDVQIQALVDGRIVSRTHVPDVASGDTRTVTLAGNDIPAGNVTLLAEYTVVGETRTVDTTLDYSPHATARVALTGVDVTRQGSMLTLRGEVANTGSADVDSVLVSVADTDRVTPAAPNREFFVGAVEASEFATFELSATPSTDVDSVPVRVSYAADGQQYSVRQTVDVSDTRTLAGDTPAAESDESSQPGGSGGGLPLLPIGAVVVLLLGVVGLYLWRRQ